MAAVVIYFNPGVNNQHLTGQYPGKIIPGSRISFPTIFSTGQILSCLK